MVGLVTRLVLAAVFLVAAIAKLRDRRGSREALLAFGLPRPLAGPVALATALAELAVAILLVPTSTAVAGALGALVLLAAFSAMIAGALARGSAPDCGCFGSLTESRVSGWTLFRNTLLGGLAVVALVAGPGESAVAWIGDLHGSERGLAIGLLASTALAVGLGAVCLVLLRRHGRLLTRIDALESELGAGTPTAPARALPGEKLPTLELGEPAPGFLAHDLDGEPVSLDLLLDRRRPIALFFTDPDCTACEPVLPAIAGLQREGARTIAVMSRGSVAATRATRDEHDLRDVLVQAGDTISLDYRAYGMPSAVLIDADGLVASDVALGAAQVEELLERDREGASR
jgi:methylamine dehydrogenase accessory protein MauD